MHALILLLVVVYLCVKIFFNYNGFDSDFFNILINKNILIVFIKITNNYRNDSKKMIHMQGLSSDINIMRNTKLSLIHKI